MAMMWRILVAALVLGSLSCFSGKGFTSLHTAALRGMLLRQPKSCSSTVTTSTPKTTRALNAAAHCRSE